MAPGVVGLGGWGGGVASAFNDALARAYLYDETDEVVRLMRAAVIDLAP
ncbi:MAG: hypothetical protein FWH11_01765 [Micrococcales bacterium]|nr:hypothetical protein [Micrococcales bacterium]